MNTKRNPEYPVEQMFIDRWSTRSFENRELPVEHIRRLFEAARWSPSSMNEQPWHLIFAANQNDRNLFLETLMDGNRLWAKDAPLLVYFLAKKQFTQRDRVNRHAAFDTGAAWMSFSLQAHHLGYHTHAMGGFYADKAHDLLMIDREEFEIMICAAVGSRTVHSSLPQELEKREGPSPRKAQTDFIHEGVMPKTD